MELIHVLTIVDVFFHMGKIWTELKDDFRAQAYQKASRVIGKTGSRHGLAHLSPGMMKKAQEIINTGTLAEMKSLRTMVRYKKLPGFSNKFISDLAKRGRAIEDAKLTRMQRISLKYQENIRLGDLDRPLVENVVQVLRKRLREQTLRFSVAGSYRRKLPLMKDIDIVIVPMPGVSTAQKIITCIKKMNEYEDFFVQGSTKFSFLWKNASDNALIQIDLRFFSLQEYPYAMLYFTGDKIFSMRTRAKAKNMGYKLNEYGLWHRGDNNKRVQEINGPMTERKILEFLGFNLKYIRPECRSEGSDCSELNDYTKDRNL